MSNQELWAMFATTYKGYSNEKHSHANFLLAQCKKNLCRL